VGELADILELVGALSETLGASLPTVEAARMEKREARGGFADRIFLEQVE
jgi:predicted house-cleaning noncanonical NTP pyrophosphatase (MazG superfamily)